MINIQKTALVALAFAGITLINNAQALPPEFNFRPAPVFIAPPQPLPLVSQTPLVQPLASFNLGK